ncbi:hypothetical protein [Virgibacillus sp. Bac332]|uniref:hypothetical protein n=1 Tax=Virgibacillus sp. Bac332 TaxID=2419842 RepID=UPI0013CE3E3A|nr:hypothetical protein [Virgibacillus sp. Bac332]
MGVLSLEALRKQKRAEKILNIPVYKGIWKDENGELTGNIIDYVDMPKHLIKKGE